MLIRRTLKILIIITIILCLFHLHQILKSVSYTEIYFNLEEYNSSGKANGFYQHDNYFCVITKDRDNKDIIKTTIHELAHLLVETDDEHFMERYKNNKELKN